MKCLNCSGSVSVKSKYCSDKCRMAYTRRTKKGDLPEQNLPEQARTLDFKLTRTDSLFEKKDPGYYHYAAEEFKRKCTICGKEFTTRLKLLSYCSPAHMEDALNALSGMGKLKKGES